MPESDRFWQFELNFLLNTALCPGAILNLKTICYVILCVVRWQYNTRKEALAAGKDIAIPRIPMTDFCQIVADSITTIPSRVIVKSFKLCGLSLAVDGSEDQLEMSPALYQLVYRDAVEWDDLPAEYKLPPVQALGGERRRVPESKRKSKNKSWRCQKCGFWSSNYYAKKTKEHREHCPIIDQIEEWAPAEMSELSFLKPLDED